MKRITEIGIIGKGKMGTDIFNFLTQKDFNIIWFCRKESDALILKSNYDNKLSRMLKRNVITPDEYKLKLQSVKFSCNLSDLKNCDLITESVIEDLTVKQDLFRSLDPVVSKDCLLTTNTSLLPLRDIFLNTEHKKNCFGLHFFYPVMLLNIVEINVMEDYDQEKCDRLKEFLKTINKEFILLNENANFLFTKLYISLVAYAYRIFTEYDLTPEEIDEVIKNNFLPLGLLTIIDSVGAYIIMKSCKNMLDERNKKLILPLMNLSSKLIEKGYTSQINSKGFLDYCKEFHIKNEKNLFPDEYKDNIVIRLKSVFLNDILNYVEKGYCGRDEVNHFSKVIFGLREEPYKILENLGSGKVYNILNALYAQTSDEIYKPSKLLKERIVTN